MLTIPDDLYSPLLKKADQTGKKPEDLLMEYLQVIAREKDDDDPLETFIGSFNSEIPDWTENHDLYLGKNLIN